MDITLINPPSPPEFRVSRGLMGGFGMAVNPELLYPPIELAHVASVLEADGHAVRIVDADASGLDVPGTVEAVAAGRPAFVCLDSSSTSLDQDLELAGRLRRRLAVPVAHLFVECERLPAAGDRTPVLTEMGQVPANGVERVRLPDPVAGLAEELQCPLVVGQRPPAGS